MHQRRALRPVLPVIASAGLLAGTLVALSGTTAQAATARYEAEASPAVCTGAIESEWSGYSGTGFCNATNATGAYVQFTASAPAAGTATLRIRFANGTTTARAATLTVNGTAAGSPSFEGTGAWSTWSTKTLTVSLAAGSNTIRLNPTTSGGLPNIDYLEVETTGDTTPPPTTGSVLYVAPNGTDGAAGTWYLAHHPHLGDQPDHPRRDDLRPRRHVLLRADRHDPPDEQRPRRAPAPS
ncbi:hypothetical protein SGLAM104S_03398 [Streptomyces glaucescens]